MRLSLIASLLTALVFAAAAVAADPNDAKTRIDGVDQARAEAQLLQVGDLGAAWTGGKKKATNFKLPACPNFHPKQSDLTVTGHIESVFTNGNGGIQVEADVQIMKTAAQVTTQYARIFRTGVLPCLQYDVLKSVGTSAKIKGATELDITGGVPVHAFRVSVTVGKTTQPIYLDFLYFAKGRTEYSVNVVAPSTQAAQLKSFEESIVTRLLARNRV
ncbi:MAG: hypothetical protein F2663_05835 [Actinobacteria bacterium]|nr:hypothetical protein [Actinomycetota bacterium]